MSWYKEVHLECDGNLDGCLMVPEHGTAPTLSDARDRAASKEGWTYNRTHGDLCVVCTWRMIKRPRCECDLKVYWEGRRPERLKVDRKTCNCTM